MIFGAETMTTVANDGCSCAKCVNLCHNPGWMTPDEARAAIDAGRAALLMIDYFSETDGRPTHVLCPASKGREGTRAMNTEDLFGGFSLFDALMFSEGLGPKITKGLCVFLSEGQCSIHDSGFKPRQCREAFGCSTGSGPDNREMSLGWANDEARALVREWMKIVGLDEKVLEECT